MTLEPPFDAARLEALLDTAGIDAVVATSAHSVRYLLGSYSSFFASFDAIGVDRYLPAVVLVRGRLEDALAVGHPIDAAAHAVTRPWVPTLIDSSHSATDTARLVAQHLRDLGLASATVAVELSFAPHRFVTALADDLRGAEIVEAAPLLEELRAIKQPHELALLREAAASIVDAIATTAAEAPGCTTAEIASRLRVEEERRGLRFEYCLVAAGASFRRAPSDERWTEGILSLDSGGRLKGYIGDLCRMAVIGEPSARLTELLDEVRALQDAARGAVAAGVPGSEVYAAVEATRPGLPHGGAMSFVAHGMGMVPHETPRLTDDAPIAYPATHRERPFEAGMVLSIETDLRIEGVGLIKLEDTVAVTAAGYEAFGDAHRHWISVGA